MTALLPFCFSCDSGDIYPKETVYDGITIETELHFTGVGAWPEDYQLILAAYGDDTENPVASQSIDQVSTDGESVKITFANVLTDAKTIAVSMVKSRKLVYKFTEALLTEGEKKVELPVQEVNLLTFNRLQSQLFSQCAACHGGSTTASAGLYLTEGQSYNMLVNHPAVHSTKMRVAPGLISGSFIVDVLGGSTDVKYNHSKLSSLKAEDVVLLKEWIENGAKNE